MAVSAGAAGRIGKLEQPFRPVAPEHRRPAPQCRHQHGAADMQRLADQRHRGDGFATREVVAALDPVDAAKGLEGRDVVARLGPREGAFFGAIS